MINSVFTLQTILAISGRQGWSALLCFLNYFICFCPNMGPDVFRVAWRKLQKINLESGFRLHQLCLYARINITYFLCEVVLKIQWNFHECVRRIIASDYSLSETKYGKTNFHLGVGICNLCISFKWWKFTRPMQQCKDPKLISIPRSAL